MSPEQPAPPDTDGFVPMHGFRDADAVPGLRDVYMRLRELASGGPPRPKVYETATGEPPKIIRCHSLEPEALWHAFSASSVVHWSGHALPWRLREMINTVTSGANNCFY